MPASDASAVSVSSWPWGKIAIAAILLVALGVLSEFIDVQQVQDYAEHLNGPLVYAAITLLPLVGFPVTVMHVLAGLRWGTGWGLAAAVSSIFLQLLLSYAIVRLFGHLFAHRLEAVRRRVPRGADGPVCLFTVLLPGVPYFAKNYVLPVMGVPLPTYLLWCFPIHAARSVVAVLFGGQTDSLTPGRIAVFAIYYAVVLAGCAWAFRRIRGQVSGRRPGAGDRKRTG